MLSSDFITITEVSPRDGLQNEATFIDTKDKVAFIDALSDTGVRHIEVSSFVSPKAIPQLADSEQVFRQIVKKPAVAYSALVPNEIGMQKALAAEVKHIALFTAASDTFNLRNIHCTIEESFLRILPIVRLAKQHHIHIRAYISCALGCPYEGDILPEQVIRVVERLIELQVDEISFGDTIGVGTPKQTLQLIKAIETIMPLSRVAMHFHDTYGQATANIYASLERGITHFDASVAGLGGCPYARGATGNVATEDVLYLMHGLGLETGIDIYKMVYAGMMICKHLNKKNQSKVANALLGNPGCSE